MPGSRSPRICIDGDKDWPIVLSIGGPYLEEIKANEKLIEQAPEMYALLKLAIGVLSPEADVVRNRIEYLFNVLDR